MTERKGSYESQADLPRGLDRKKIEQARGIVEKMDLFRENWRLNIGLVGFGGEEGSGKTTVVYSFAHLYHVSLERLHTVGQIQRELSRSLKERELKKGKRQSVLNSDQARKDTAFMERDQGIDLAIDRIQETCVTNANPTHPTIFESRLVAQIIKKAREKSQKEGKAAPSAIAIKITADEEARWKRLAKRSGKSIDEVKAETLERRKLDMQQYKKAHKGSFEEPYDPKFFDLVIDNTYPELDTLEEELLHEVDDEIHMDLTETEILRLRVQEELLEIHNWMLENGFVKKAEKKQKLLPSSGQIFPN